MSISMFAIGSPHVMGAAAWEPGTWIGLGIFFYGIIYTLVHDGLVHQRYFRWVPRRGYAKRLVQAHKLHHATLGKEGGVSFGFVFARDPAKLKAELKAQREAGIAVVRSEEHTSELQSLMRSSYAVFCLKKKRTTDNHISCERGRYAPAPGMTDSLVLSRVETPTSE